MAEKNGGRKKWWQKKIMVEEKIKEFNFLE
jgi:hypothetical protein